MSVMHRHKYLLISRMALGALVSTGTQKVLSLDSALLCGVCMFSCFLLQSENTHTPINTHGLINGYKLTKAVNVSMNGCLTTELY